MIFKRQSKQKTTNHSLRGNKAHLNLENISFSFDKLISDNISISINKGEIISFLGPSGSGKTTMLKLIAGLERPTTGNIYMDNKAISSKDMFVKIEKRKIGMVFEQAMLFPHLTIEENVKFGLKKSKYNNERVSEVLDLVGLKSIKKRHPHTLSG